MSFVKKQNPTTLKVKEKEGVPSSSVKNSMGGCYKDFQEDLPHLKEETETRHHVKSTAVLKPVVKIVCKQTIFLSSENLMQIRLCLTNT